MPKKTKKQKIIAAYHKKMMSAKEEIAVASKPTIVQTEVKKNDQTKQEIEAPNPANSFFFSDMRKSLVLIALVIALEIALYFAKLIR